MKGTEPLRAARLLGAALAATAALTACGAEARHAGPPVVPALTEFEWIDNAARFVEGLGSDVALSADGGSNLVSARAALHDESALYAMLVAYTAFDGCERALAGLGPPARRLRRVAQRLAAACREFQRASSLFSIAVKRSSPSVLLAATRTTLAASPLLYDVKSDLEALGAARDQSSFHNDASSCGRGGRFGARTQGAPISARYGRD